MVKSLNYDKRVVFPFQKQQEFLVLAKKKLGFSWPLFADKIAVNKRTLNDWQRERYTLPFGVLKKICTLANLKTPINIEIREPFWSTKKAAQIAGKLVYKKYGRVGGDPEYRKKKWREWWKEEGKYKKHPIINVSKSIEKPHFSKELAEFVGIMMGDGGITRYQIKVSLNREDDKEYGYFVENLIKKLFSVPVARHYRKDSLEMNLVVSRIELVKFCNRKLGLKIGNKLEQKLDIPRWIKNNIEYQKSCLRGLIDTDGCLFYERHKIKNKVYSYRRLNFTSYSSVLRSSVFFLFKKLNMSPKIRNNRSVQIENKDEINQYFAIIGTHNPKHERRFLKESRKLVYARTCRS